MYNWNDEVEWPVSQKHYVLMFLYLRWRKDLLLTLRSISLGELSFCEALHISHCRFLHLRRFRSCSLSCSSTPISSEYTALINWRKMIYMRWRGWKRVAPLLNNSQSESMDERICCQIDMGNCFKALPGPGQCWNRRSWWIRWQTHSTESCASRF